MPSLFNQAEKIQRLCLASVILALIAVPIQAQHGEDEILSSMSPEYSDNGYCHADGGLVGWLIDWRRADLWAGMCGFTLPSNFVTGGTTTAGQVEGAFGFHEGINFGSCLPEIFCGQLGSQLGVRAVQANLDGTSAGMDSRNQLFATGGLFHRVDYGWQGGLVVDYLHDDWIYQADLVQLRGELSFLLSPCHDLGFRFTNRQATERATAILANSPFTSTVNLGALETYRFFYRYQFGECGQGQAEFHGGFSEEQDGILGMQLSTPLHGELGLQTSATYLIPRSNADPGFQFEGWNIGLALVWTPGRCFGSQRDYYRPLFDVADNGSFINSLLP